MGGDVVLAKRIGHVEYRLLFFSQCKIHPRASPAMRGRILGLHFAGLKGKDFKSALRFCATGAFFLAKSWVLAPLIRPPESTKTRGTWRILAFGQRYCFQPGDDFPHCVCLSGEWRKARLNR